MLLNAFWHEVCNWQKVNPAHVILLQEHREGIFWHWVLEINLVDLWPLLIFDVSGE